MVKKKPSKHQLLIKFDDESVFAASVQMYGGYFTKLSKKTVNKPCQVCGGDIVKKSYMGGSVYYYEVCQQL